MISAQEVHENKRFSGVKSAARNSAFLLSMQFSSILIRLVYLLILARSVAPESYGVLIYAMSWYLIFLPLTYLGADVVLSREIGRQRVGAATLLGATLGSRLIAIPVLLVICVLSAVTMEHDAFLRSLVVLLSLSLVGRSLWMWSAAVLTAFEEPRPVIGFEVAARAAEIGVLLLLIGFKGPDLFWIAAIHAASWTLQGFASVALVWRRYGINFDWPNASWLAVVRDGVPGAIFSIAMATFAQLPIVLFRQIHGTGDSLGHFALAFQIVTYLLAIPYVVANASLPVLSRSAERKDRKDRKAVIILSAVIILGGTAAAIAASFAAAPAVIWLLGVNYSPVAAILAAGLWMLVPGSLAILIQQILFSNSVQSYLATAGPLIGVVLMALSFPGLARTSEYEGPLLAVGVGFCSWLAISLFQTFRIGFFGKRVDPASPAAS